jgi:hypothetical protein
MRFIAQIFVVAITLAFVCNAEAKPRDGREDAEADFRAGKPKVAWFGTFICMPAYGVQMMDAMLLKSLPKGPSYCDPKSRTQEQDGEYVKDYNQRMVELIKDAKLQQEQGK